MDAIINTLVRILNYKGNKFNYALDVLYPLNYKHSLMHPVDFIDQIFVKKYLKNSIYKFKRKEVPNSTI